MRKPRKYRSSLKHTKRKRSAEGNNYRSKYEATVCADLESRGVTYQYEPTTLKYTYEANYVPDLLLPNGVFVELKGFLDYEDRRKLESVLRSNPGIKLRILFYRNNRLRRNSKTLYSDWAERVGIPWAVGNSIPEDWLSE